MTKKLKKTWEQVPPDYYEKGIKTNIFQFIWHSWKWATMKRILEKINLRPTKILDVGCASGHITEKIAKLFPNSQVFGLDAYEQAVKLGKKLHQGIYLKVGDVHKLPFRDETFDLITCIETLEHLENPEKALLEIKRVLKKNGKVLVGQDTNNWLFRLVWFFWTKGKGKVWAGSHINPLTTKLLENLIKKVGFKIKLQEFSQADLEVFFLAEKL